jgi:hypothetical protein
MTGAVATTTVVQARGSSITAAPSGRLPSRDQPGQIVGPDDGDQLGGERLGASDLSPQISRARAGNSKHVQLDAPPHALEHFGQPGPSPSATRRTPAPKG